MGLGKTMEVLGLIKNTPAVKSTLLLAPKAVLEQWRQAAVRSRINVCLPSVGKKGEKDRWERPQPFFPGSSQTLFIANYDKLLHRATLFKDREFDRVVLDEAHRIRNRSTALTAQVFKISAPRRWAVTATPVVNALSDINTLFLFAGYPKEKMGTIVQALKLTEEAVLYRSMEEMREVLRELPNAPTVAQEQLDFLTEEEQEFYQGIQGAIVRRWKALEHDGHSAKMRLLLLMRLRQISLHPQVYINAIKKNNPSYHRRPWSGDSTKFVALRNKIEAAPNGARWIVFCQFHDEIDILEAYLEKSAAIQSVYKYDGRMSMDVKEATIETTRNEVLENGKHSVLLLQLHSGGVGLNLQHFSKIIFLSPWWTAALMDQAIGRAVRIGQTERVEVTHMVLKEEMTLNIDQYMMEAAERKRGLCAKILSHAAAGRLGAEDGSAEEDDEGWEEGAGAAGGDADDEPEEEAEEDDEENPRALTAGGGN
jgi:SNF2 family DNA or RNA helicase